MLIPIEIARGVATQAANEAFRYPIDCIHFERLSPDRLRAVATNGRCMIVCDWDEQPVADHHKMLVPERAEPGFSALIPAATAVEIAPKTKSPMELTEVGDLAGVHLGFRHNRCATEITLNEKPSLPFPEYRKVIPYSCGSVSITFNPRMMVGALNAMIGCGVAPEGDSYVTLRVSDPHKPMTLEARGHDGRECLVVLMPASGDVETSILPRGAMT